MFSLSKNEAPLQSLAGLVKYILIFVNALLTDFTTFGAYLDSNIFSEIVNKKNVQEQPIITLARITNR